MNAITRWWRGPEPPQQRIEPRIDTPTRRPMKISDLALDRLSAASPAERVNPYQMPRYAPGVLPDGADKLAMDEAPNQQINAAFGYGASYHGLWEEGIGFEGYPFLAALSQRPEYRTMSELLAEEMTRKWIILKGVGDKNKSAKITRLTDAMKRFRLREAFRDATMLDGLMGLCPIHIDLGTSDDPAEMVTKLVIDKAKIAKGSLKGFKPIDPIWIAPTDYNSTNPLLPNFYKPQLWFVMGMRVHASRLLMIVSRPVPDLLKPAYNFGGLSLSQMLKPYVQNWLRARQSVSDLLNSFTVFTLATNMMGILEGEGGADMDKRLEMFTAHRNNRGLFAIDKETEEFTNTSAPLGTLDALQAQAQEQQAAIVRAPLIKAFGITPTGLNASTDGEVRSWYDLVHAYQEKVFNDPLKTALDVLQLNEFGEIDPGITFEFVSLWELDAAGQAAVQKMKADTDSVLATEGAIGPDEIRKRVADDPESGYHGLEGDAPGMPETDADPDLNDPAERIGGLGAAGNETGANSGV